MSDEEQDILEELRQSYNKFGPIRKVIITPYGIAAGNTRKKAVPEWPEKKLEADKVKSYYEHLRIMAADNIQVEKKPEWWTDILAKAAKELEKQGVEKGKIVARLEQDFPISKRTIYRYLPQEFKDPVKVKAGEANVMNNSVATVATQSAEKSPETSKYPRASAPKASEFRKSTYTDSHQILLAELSRKHIPFQSEVPFERPGEFTEDHKPKSYQADVVIGDRLIVEVDGAGHDFEADDKRDKFFKDKHYTIRHFPNELVEKYPEVVADFIHLMQPHALEEHRITITKDGRILHNGGILINNRFETSGPAAVCIEKEL